MRVPTDADAVARRESVELTKTRDQEIRRAAALALRFALFFVGGVYTLYGPELDVITSPRSEFANGRGTYVTVRELVSIW